jgi:DNA-binding Lrp family transcriptional regulator
LARFTALVQIFAESTSLDAVERALSKLDNLEALFEVTGEFDVVALVSAADSAEFREVMRDKIRSIKGIKATAISVVLKDVRAPIQQSEDESPQPAGGFHPRDEVLVLS